MKHFCENKSPRRFYMGGSVGVPHGWYEDEHSPCPLCLKDSGEISSCLICGHDHLTITPVYGGCNTKDQHNIIKTEAYCEECKTSMTVQTLLNPNSWAIHN